MIRTFFAVCLDALTFIQLCFKPTTVLAAENLFLRKQLGLFVEPRLTGWLTVSTVAGWCVNHVEEQLS
jgi:hypothetical protein